MYKIFALFRSSCISLFLSFVLLSCIHHALSFQSKSEFEVENNLDELNFQLKFLMQGSLVRSNVDSEFDATSNNGIQTNYLISTSYAKILETFDYTVVSVGVINQRPTVDNQKRIYFFQYLDPTISSPLTPLNISTLIQHMKVQPVKPNYSFAFPAFQVPIEIENVKTVFCVDEKRAISALGSQRWKKKFDRPFYFLIVNELQGTFSFLKKIDTPLASDTTCKKLLEENTIISYPSTLAEYQKSEQEKALLPYYSSFQLNADILPSEGTKDFTSYTGTKQHDIQYLKINAIGRVKRIQDFTLISMAAKQHTNHGLSVNMTAYFVFPVNPFYTLSKSSPRLETFMRELSLERTMHFSLFVPPFHVVSNFFTKGFKTLCVGQNSGVVMSSTELALNLKKIFPDYFVSTSTFYFFLSMNDTQPPMAFSAIDTALEGTPTCPKSNF